MSKQISLIPIYLNPIKTMDKSFIKPVVAGTGLGKTYSGERAVYEYWKEEEASEVPEICIYTAPQHNQIKIDKKLKDEFEVINSSYEKILPISPDALSDLSKEYCSYNLFNKLFFTETGDSALLKDLRKVLKSIDEANNNGLSKILSDAERLYKFCKLDKERIEKSASSTAEDEDLYLDFDSYSNEVVEHRLKNNLLELTKTSLSLYEKSYKDDDFREELDEKGKTGGLNKIQIKTFREVTRALYPFIDFQYGKNKNAFYSMTIDKLLFRHSVLIPVIKGDKVRFSSVKLNIQSIFSDIDEERLKFQESIDYVIENYPDKNCYERRMVRLFEANLTYLCDEADASKNKIARKNIEYLDDDRLIQSIGSFVKESNHVIFNDDYVDFVSDFKKSGFHSLLDFMRSHMTDDRLDRILAKENILGVRKKLYETLIENGWEFTDKYSSVEQLMEAVNKFARHTSIATYMTVDRSVDPDIFNRTSVFGGEFYGFNSTKYLDRFIVVNTNDSFRIENSNRSRLYPESSYLPLSLFFLMISEFWIYFRLIIKNRGGDAIDRKNEETIENILTQETSEKQLRELQDFANKQRNADTGALSAIGEPYRINKRENGETVEINLHTAPTKKSNSNLSKISQSNFEGALAPKASLEEMIDGSPQNFATAKVKPIDTVFAHKQIHTTYGMVQVQDDVYKASHLVTHVRFPIHIFIMSEEFWLVKLARRRKGVVRIFTMTATGGFENCHISAFSNKDLTSLCEQDDVAFLPFTDEDSHLTQLKQKERLESKELLFTDFGSLLNESGDETKSIKSAFQSSKIRNSKFLRQPNGVGLGTFKQRELSNIFDAIAWTSDSAHKEPRFSLAVCQTNRNFSHLLQAIVLAGDGVIWDSDTGKRYRVEALDNTKIGEAIRENGVITELKGMPKHSIFILSPLSDYNAFATNNGESRKTVIINYVAAFESWAQDLFKAQDKHKQAISYKLKELLGLPTSYPVLGSNDYGFNPMSVFLNSNHGCNVVIVSAYQSAGRGLNLIVNEKGTSNYWKSRGKKSESKQEYQPSLLDEPTQLTQSTQVKSRFPQRDIDSLFFCLSPYYTETNTKETENASLKEEDTPDKAELAQKLFYKSVEKYHRYLAHCARVQKPDEEELMSSEIDLISPSVLPDAIEYFAEQDDISRTNEMIQAIGRLERTSTKQKQMIVADKESQETYLKGLLRLSEDIDRSLMHMSAFNSQIAKSLLEFGIQALDYSPSEAEKFLHEANEKAVVFERGKSYLLNVIDKYRSVSRIDSERFVPLINFYEAFRSSVLWTSGKDEYLSQLNAAFEDLPKRSKGQLHGFIDSLFVDSESTLHYFCSSKKIVGQRATQVFDVNGGAHIDMNELHSEICVANELYPVENIFYQKRGEIHSYIAPWFIADAKGNFGEYALDEVLHKLKKHNVELLERNTSEVARRCYEYADRFISFGEKLFALDAKTYTTLINPSEKRIFYKLGEIQNIYQGEAQLVIINTYTNKEALRGLKKGLYGNRALSSIGIEDRLNNVVMELLRLITEEEV